MRFTGEKKSLKPNFLHSFLYQKHRRNVFAITSTSPPFPVVLQELWLNWEALLFLRKPPRSHFPPSDLWQLFVKKFLHQIPISVLLTLCFDCFYVLRLSVAWATTSEPFIVTRKKKHFDFVSHPSLSHSHYTWKCLDWQHFDLLFLCRNHRS